MTLTDRVEFMQEIFELLQSTNSRLKKQEIIDSMPPELRQDFDYCLEVLAGRHVFGYKYQYVDGMPIKEFKTIRECLEYLQEPYTTHDLSYSNIYKHLAATCFWADFLEPLVNREYKLGIGQSVIAKSDTAPMLAKKYEGHLPYDDKGWAITEKLDGNRCIAYHDGAKWQFVSRNGKRMNVDFDMSGLPEELVYDGEVVSPTHIERSIYISHHVCDELENVQFVPSASFNSTSGLINRKRGCKDLVYCIFDIQDTSPYLTRRTLLNHLDPLGKDVKILPCLYVANCNETYTIDRILATVVAAGGEGIMLNRNGASYQAKRTSDLLKYKEVQTMDMLVIDTFEGKGKYEGMCGGIVCKFENMQMIVKCDVGTGLSDRQREEWRDKAKIVGKIVEIAYFELSQNKDTYLTGNFSLRFPRLVKVREDKNTTSEF